MNSPFYEFQIDLYHAKLEFMAIKSGYKEKPWSNSEDQKLNAVHALCDRDYNPEAHLLAAKTHFQSKFSFSEILDALYETAKHSKDYPNTSVFTTLLYNRLKLRLSK